MKYDDDDEVEADHTDDDADDAGGGGDGGAYMRVCVCACVSGFTSNVPFLRVLMRVLQSALCPSADAPRNTNADTSSMVNLFRLGDMSASLITVVL